MTLYVIRSGVISEKDLCEIQNRPLHEQIEIYTILAQSCGGAAKTHNEQWRRNDQERPLTFCGIESLRISGEKDMWQEKAKASLSALVESRFQHG